MKKLVYTLAVIFTISLTTVSCTKQDINEDEKLLETQSIDRGESSNSGSIRTKRDRDNSEG